MQLNCDVVIFSIFGKGISLAKKYKNLGYEVAIIDVSKKFNHWVNEYINGPFGFFVDPSFSSEKKSNFLSELHCDVSEVGFCFWLPDGPLELKSAITKHQLQSKNISSDVYDYLNPLLRTPEILNKIKTIPFSDSWIAYFAHEWNSNSNSSQYEAIKRESYLPLFSEYFIAQKTWESVDQELEVCEIQGIHVIRTDKIQDICIEKKRKSAEFIIDDQRSINAKVAVNFLTDEQLKFVNDSIKLSGNRFSPKKVAYWDRFKVKISGIPEKVLPLQTICIQDFELPWDGSNAFVLQRSYDHKLYDIWIKLNYENYGDLSYFNSVVSKIIEILKLKIPGCEINLFESSKIQKFKEEQVGPVFWPIYNSSDLKKVRWKHDCMLKAGADVQGGLDFISEEKHINIVADYIDNILGRSKVQGTEKGRV